MATFDLVLQAFSNPGKTGRVPIAYCLCLVVKKYHSGELCNPYRESIWQMVMNEFLMHPTPVKQQFRVSNCLLLTLIFKFFLFLYYKRILETRAHLRVLIYNYTSAYLAEYILRSIGNMIMYLYCYKYATTLLSRHHAYLYSCHLPGYV
jgi:hypothetical protein